MKTKSEHAIQNEIRNALAGLCILFRANVGTGWQGVGKAFKAPKPMVVHLAPGDVVLRQARPFDTGLPPGFSDTFGFVDTEITQDMVGSTFPRAVFGEVKTEDGRPTPIQAQFLSAMKSHNAIAGVWRSKEQALAAIQAKELK